MLRSLRSLVLLVTMPCLAFAGEQADQFQWLEDIQGAKALAWVKEQNRQTTRELEATKDFKPIYDRTLEILDSRARIPDPTLLGNTVYNFWKDAEHERGIWRRTTLESYRSDEPRWETVLDVDALAKEDGVPWVYKGAACLAPEYRHCMISLSRGGSDAAVDREFDTVAKSFVASGFNLPEGKNLVDWRDPDTLWVGADFGEGSLTASGYPRVVRLWKRGTPLSAARVVFQGLHDDVAVQATSEVTAEGRYDVVMRVPAFYRQETFLVLGDRLVKLDLPQDADFKGFFADHLLVALRSDWTVGGETYPQGALLAIGLDDFLAGKRHFDVLFRPDERSSLDTVTTTRDAVLVVSLENVRGKLTALTIDNGTWQRRDVELPGLGTVGVAATSPVTGTYFFTYQDFLTPSSLYLVEHGVAAKVKSMPAYFIPDGMQVVQHEATSEDGTRIPYFVVTPPGFQADGANPALLYGYGGFEVSEVPTYSAVMGSAWLARGGVYALANIRGGGEFGPAWHSAAVKKNRIKSFQDFIAVAEDLIARKFTSPRRLGIMGGSQGGLLVGGAFTMRPDLFHAVVSQVPLADMRRFNKLLAGASWMGEYGDPDIPEQWEFIKTWSPYHLLRPDVKYPKVFFWTNTRDDRVHPGHARKMVAKMEAMGHPVYYFENTEGGHGSGAVNTQKAYIEALQYAYLWKMLR